MDIGTGAYFAGEVCGVIKWEPVNSGTKPFYAYVAHQAVQKSGRVSQLIREARLGGFRWVARETEWV